jgi:hypothetical protein
MKRQGGRVRDVVWRYMPSRSSQESGPGNDKVADEQPKPEVV